MQVMLSLLCFIADKFTVTYRLNSVWQLVIIDSIYLRHNLLTLLDPRFAFLLDAALKPSSVTGVV